MSVRGDGEMPVILHGKRATPMERVGRSDAAVEMRKKEIFMILASCFIGGTRKGCASPRSKLQ